MDWLQTTDASIALTIQPVKCPAHFTQIIHPRFPTSDDRLPAFSSATVRTRRTSWNQIASSIEEDKPQGEQALNALFQQIFRDANDDTRKAMIKSFTESNGTCLSTNWDEVGKKKVDVTPPEGMVAKQFEN